MQKKLTGYYIDTEGNSNQISEIKSDDTVYCPDCSGDGKETCHNPDHGFLESVLGSRDEGRLGCPVCGHDDDHKAAGGDDCDTCEGSGKVSYHEFEDFCIGMEYDTNTVFSCVHVCRI